MDNINCLNCKKIIYVTPCPYCGFQQHQLLSTNQKHLISSDTSYLKIVEGSTEVKIKKDDILISKSFSSGVTSDFIAVNSLSAFDLNQEDSHLIYGQVVANINSLESIAKENKIKITDEISFGLNFGFIKFDYKRKIEK